MNKLGSSSFRSKTFPRLEKSITAQRHCKSYRISPKLPKIDGRTFDMVPLVKEVFFIVRFFAGRSSRYGMMMVMFFIFGVSI